MTARLVALCGLLSLSSCSKPEAPVRRTEPWPAQPSASAHASAEAPQSYRFSPDSLVRFTLQGKRDKVSGRLPLDVAHATLQLDLRDLKSSRARIDFDLTKLSVDAEALPDDVDLGGRTPDGLAQQWLELGPNVAAERRREFGTARFELVSVESAVNALDPRARRPQSVRATVVGTLLLHGFRAPVRADVVLSAVESPAGGPQRVSIRSVGAVVVPLAPHEIVARGPSGIADVLAMARSARWVGKQAKLELELFAEAEPGNK